MKEKLKTALQKFKYQAASIEDLKVTKRGNMYAYGKEKPYERFDAKISRLPIGDVSGIISVTTAQDGTNRILVAVNEK